jgi:hypothetical protein
MLRDRAVEAMAKAIEGLFADSPPADWSPEAEAALDALLDTLEANADEWAIEAARQVGFIVGRPGRDGLLAVLRGGGV